MPEELRFIIALTQHRFLGPVFVPYLVEVQPVCMVVKGLVTPGDATAHEPALSPLQKEIVTILGRCTASSLARRFSRDFVTADFFAPANNATIEKNVIPWVHKQMYRVALLLMEGETPLYEKESQYSRIYEEDQIMVPREWCRPVFHFNRGTEEMTYRMQLFTENREVTLFHRDTRIISASPCVMVADHQLLIFEKLDAPKIKPFTTREEIHIPRSMEEKYFKSFILPLVRDYDIESEGFIVREVAVVATPLLCLENDLRMLPVIVLKFRYGDELCIAADRRKTFVRLDDSRKFSFSRITRDRAKENAAAAFLGSMGLRARESFYSLPNMDLLQREQAVITLIDWISRHHGELLEAGFEIIREGWGKEYFVGKREIVAGISRKTDWFDVYAVVTIGEFRFPFVKLRKYLLNGIREFELPDGRVAILPEEWFARYRFLIPFAKGSGNHISLSLHHFPLLQSLGLKEGDEILRQLTEEFANLEEISLPGGLKAELRGYQISGFRWMVTLWRHRLGGCLSDDMGLGKTLQAIALLLKVRKKPPFADQGHWTSGRQLSLFDDLKPRDALVDGSIPESPDHGDSSGISAAGDEPVVMRGDKNRGMGKDSATNEPLAPAASLIVMPASLVHNWMAELRRFAPSLRVYRHTGAQRNRQQDLNRLISTYDVILTTYGTLRNDTSLFSGLLFNGLILDESQYIKNPASKSYKAVMELHSLHRFVLTGTPVENSLSDLWAQMNFLNPGLLGSFSFFRQNFLVPIENNGDQEVSDKLRQMVRPFILRRTKAEVAADLPPLMEQSIVCAMTDTQRSLYETEKSLIRNTILANIEARGMARSSLVILQGMTRLRQIAIHPQLLRGESNADSGKYNEIMESLMNLVAEKHKVLVFSSFVTHLGLIRQGVEAAGLKYSLLTGRTTNREEVIRNFQETSDNYIFLISMKAGGVGLNLTSADYVFIVDPWWNPAVEEQALSRAHRIGQVRNTFVYRFVTGDTIEEKIGSLKERKKSLADRFINRNNPFGSVSQDDLLELIG